MTWPALLAALFELLSPILLAWLRDLLKRANLATGACPENTALAIHDVFANARAELSLWDRLRGRGRVLAACERVAIARAKDVATRAAGSGVPLVLTGVEYDRIATA